ncbi:uncharacterized protein [Dermacentor albipictus]|uniref:uncharacterized protein n=1 Tax=Dermacentor albipictus TaxID=60249 RepID=UPI0038FC8A82
MGASHFLLLLLATGLAQAAWNSHSSLPSVNPWATHTFRDWLRSALLNRLWSFLPQKNTGDDQESLYQDDGMDHVQSGAPTTTDSVLDGAHFGGDYGFPRYGGQSRMSRYGIDYGDYHARLNSFREHDYRRPFAHSFGVPDYAEFHDGLTYPRWTHQFSGQEHPTTFDPYRANPYYQNPFHAQRFVEQNPYFRI